MRAIITAVAAAIAFGTVAYAALDYANQPMPIHYAHKHQHRITPH